MQVLRSFHWLPLSGAFLLISGYGRLAGAVPALGAVPPTESSAVAPTQGAETAPEPERLDSKYPYPPREPAVSEVHGIQVLDWGYRFTRPGLPDNSILIQAKIRSKSKQALDGLLVTGLQHGVPWVLPQPAWFRVEMQEIHLSPAEETTITTEFPKLQSIHLGVKSGFYKPRVLVKEVDDFNDDSQTVQGVRILEWNYTIVRRPRGPHPAKFIAVLRNLNPSAKRVILRTELIPKSDTEDYGGPPEGFSEDHVIQIPEGKNVYLADMPMISTSGLSRVRVRDIFDAGIHIVGVEEL